MSSSHHVIVDGSNLATEGRMMPSLVQLDDCVQAYKAEDPTATIVVVVDATFGHRIDPSEKATYDEAIDHGELLTPPAGAVGRGDGFILKIAEKVNAVVLSNDSFQEFHGEYPWLFDEGRLIGGKPVPTIGWVFTPRSPVRGPKSRHATSKAQGSGKSSTRALPAKKLTIALPDGAKPSIGDVISPPPRPVEPTVPDVAAPKKRVAKKQVAAPLQPSTVDSSSGQPEVAKKRTAKKATTRKVSPVQVSAKVEAPRLEAPKKRTARKAAAAVTEVVASAEGASSGVEVLAPKKRAARTTKAVAKELTSEPVAVLPKRGVKKATKAEVAPAKKVAVKKPSQKATSGKQPVPVNEPMGFLTFVSAHPVDAQVTGTVASFTSHGAMVTVVVDGETQVLCYAPTKCLSDPPPKSAREVLGIGQTYEFRVLSLDVQRRVAEVTLAS